ncbi:MAG: hypothetical protein V9H25_06680 [Candidatus Competibacter sp.]
MPFRNPKYIYFASITHIELLLAVILILTGLAFVLPAEHINQEGSKLFQILGNVRAWGLLFCATGTGTLIRIWWNKKPNWLVTEILRHTTNFLFSMLSISMLLAYPLLPWSATYLCLAVSAFFAAARFDKREHY